MFIVTENSTYEIDQANKRIRKIRGDEASFPHQISDNQWKEYKDISMPRVGEPMFIVWGFQESPEGMRTKGTMTSLIKSVRP